MWKYNMQLSSGITISIGASGAIFGVVGAVLLIVIKNRGELENMSTADIVRFVVFSLYGGIVNARIVQAAHIGGFLAGFVLAKLLYRKPTINIRRRV
jgi:rhomboid protease GluP